MFSQPHATSSTVDVEKSSTKNSRSSSYAVTMTGTIHSGGLSGPTKNHRHHNHELKRQYSIVNGLKRANDHPVAPVFGSKWPNSFVQTPGEVTTVCFSPDGQYLAAGDQSELVVRSVITGKVVQNFTSEGLIMGTAFSPDSQWLAACDTAGYIIVRQVKDGAVVWQKNPEEGMGNNACVRCIAFSCSTSSSDQVSKWETKFISKQGINVKSNTPESHPDLVLAAGNWSSECCLYDMTIGDNGKVKPNNAMCIDPTTKKTIFVGEGYVRTIAFDPKNKTCFAYGGEYFLRMMHLCWLLVVSC